MRHPFPGVLPAVGLLAGLAACAGGPRPVTGAPVSPTGPAAGPGTPTSILPPIPHVTGPLIVNVVYPRAGSLVASRDSNFILGSVGTGDATLTINGVSVPVQPNGAFLGWLAVPDSALSRYDLVAIAGNDTVRLTHPVKLLPPPRLSPDSALDSLAALARPFPDSGRYVTVEPLDSTLPDTDRMVIARPIAGGTYKWFLLPGTVLQVTGRSPGFERVRLDDVLEAWVSLGDTRLSPLPLPARPAQRVASNIRVVPAPGWVDVVIGMTDRPAYLVEESGHDLTLTAYGTQASTSVIHYLGKLDGPPGPPDTLVQSVTWTQETSSRARFSIHLSSPPFGYLVLWTGSAFVLRVRRPPVIDPASPLRGLTIAVDAGHPPAGATGPTGLYEPVATLAVAEQIETMLVARGATVVMTRRTADPLDLAVRPVMARRVDADALVSIHSNALPDGMNPFIPHGTGTYFFQPQSLELARAVQAGMVRALRLRDLGIHYDNLALVRPTWMPSVLCEGALIIIPEQEAALRTPDFQAAYARGVVNGLDAFFRSLAPGSAAAGGEATSPPAPPPASPVAAP